MTLQTHEIPSVLLDTRKELLGCGIADLIRDAYLWLLIHDSTTPGLGQVVPSVFVAIQC
jgi:hypothetical protein